MAWSPVGVALQQCETLADARLQVVWRVVTLRMVSAPDGSGFRLGRRKGAGRLETEYAPGGRIPPYAMNALTSIGFRR